MTSFNKYKTFQTIAWITNDQSSIMAKQLYLEEQGINVQVSDSIESWQSRQFEIAPFLFLIDINCTDQATNNSNDQALIKLIENSPSESFILVGLFKNTTLEHKERFIALGGNACLNQPFGNAELLQLIQSYSKQLQDNFDFKAQLSEASQMALLAMENSSELGGIIKFIKDAMLSKHYPELAEQIFKATEMNCESCLIEIKGHDTNYYFSANKSSGSLIKSNIDKDMQQYLLSQKLSGRIVKLDNILQINQSNLSILLDGVPFQDSSKIERLSDNLVILSDVANRFAQNLATEENLLKTEKERQSFLNTLSHELKTPLNGILGFSKALRTKTSDKPLGISGLDALERIIESTEQINGIISTLIEISGNNSQNTDQRDQKVEVDSLLIRLQNEFKQAALNKGLKFESHSPPNLHLFSDSNKIYNILKRIVDNAIKFTDNGWVSIEVNTDSSSDHNQQIIFKVKDSGIGIAAKNHRKIFNEIGQLNTEHDRSHYGIGLGLYYSHLVAQQIKGDLEVESSLGNGSCFSLTLPFTAENNSNNNHPEKILSPSTDDLDDYLF